VEITAESVADGVTERRFDLKVAGETVPGLHWLPEGEPRATVLLGHGGTGSKRAPNITALAGRLVRECGYAAVALDAPAHGDRMSAEQRAAMEARVAARQQRETPGGRGLAPSLFRSLMDTAPQAAAEWQGLLDELGPGAFGYYGVSMGTVYGMRLLAGEPRISVAALGLGGLLEEEQRRQAAAITIPVLFLFQWDDTLMEREQALALWDAFGSADKTMHVNPGPHGGIPDHERDAVVAFLHRHLG
jgi:dienelactone hydrolase